MNRMANLVQAIALLSIASVFVGLLGRWHFFADLASHFRVQAAATSLVAGLLLWPLKRPRWAITCSVFGVGLSASLLPFLWPSPVERPGPHRLLTLNVLTSNAHPDLVVGYIVKHDPDFVILQETSPSWIQVLDHALLKSWPYSKSVPRSDNFGIAIYSRVPWSSCTVVEHPAEVSTPAISALFDLPHGRPLRIIATHPVPPMSTQLWRSRNSLFAELASDVQSAIPDRTIVAGDLNCSPWSYWFARFCKDSGLRDSAIGQGINATWMPIPIPAFGLPIDHVLVGGGIRVSHREVGPFVGSDHRPVVVDFD